MKKCDVCGNDTFRIDEIKCCDDCSENGAWDSADDAQELTWDEKLIFWGGLERCQVEEESECRMGSAYGRGCHMYICTECRQKEHLPFGDEC